jgi:nanoRNase/pAp phosphatase (c-di-AMP/oligoRNAs hydrolase)
MESFPEFNQIQTALTSAQLVYVVLPQILGLDKVASALSIYLSLKKIGKQTTVYCAKPMIVKYSNLVGVDKIKQKLEGKNLTVSFDYVADSIEKVSYNIQNNKFNLLIQPKDGFPPLATEKVNYSYSGGQADLILVIGAAGLTDLGPLYSENQEFFGSGNIINIDIQSTNSQFGKINLVKSNLVSYSELATSLLAGLRLPVDSDMAGNLLKGIEEATNYFSGKIAPLSFEAAAFCLRAGANKDKTKIELKPMTANISAQKTPLLPEEKEEPPSPDWMAPKIYKGGQLI